MARKAAAVIAALIMSLLLGGCMETSADSLYALPQLSEGYLRLQSAIDSVLSSGAEYAAPSTGANRQPIQREDLDGDGVREVIAFFNFAGSDRPLKIIVFRNEDGEYNEIARIEGEGTGIESINYLDMNGDGIREVAVGWQMGAGINMLSVYSINGWQVNRIVSTNYSEYTVCDMDGETGSDILVLRLSPSELTGQAEHYALTGDGEVVTGTAWLSSGSEALLRVRATPLLGGRSAVLVESTIGGGTGIVTDILAWKNGNLANITLDENSGFSDGTQRLTYAVYCRDINSDGVIDVPQPTALPSTTGDTTYYTIDWYSYYSSGARKLVCTTYSNYTDSWYLVLPDTWKDKMTLSREEGASGERMIIFSTVKADGTRGTDFLAVYTLTGEKREERAAMGGRFVLSRSEETVYAARILTENALPVSRQMLIDNFGLIYSEWITGET